jgi:hypothetical protein
MHLGTVQAVCFSADPNCGRFPPPKEKSHDVRLSHDVHCRDAWPLRVMVGSLGLMFCCLPTVLGCFFSTSL